MLITILQWLHFHPHHLSLAPSILPYIIIFIIIIVIIIIPQTSPKELFFVCYTWNKHYHIVYSIFIFIQNYYDYTFILPEIQAKPLNFITSIINLYFNRLFFRKFTFWIYILDYNVNLYIFIGNGDNLGTGLLTNLATMFCWLYVFGGFCW